MTDNNKHNYIIEKYPAHLDNTNNALFCMSAGLTMAIGQAFLPYEWQPLLILGSLSGVITAIASDKIGGSAYQKEFIANLNHNLADIKKLQSLGINNEITTEDNIIRIHQETQGAAQKIAKKSSLIAAFKTNLVTQPVAALAMLAYDYLQ
jgi:hypothetical protein